LPFTVLPATQTLSSLPLPSSEPAPPLPRVAALGGTFDHLHAGHKILLTTGAMLCSEKLIVGVTTDTLLASKSNAPYLESLTERKARVRGFLQAIKPHIIHDVVTIDDVYGPTGWDPDIQVLIVSHETISGADAIARHRESKGLPPLRPFVIDVISADDPRLDPQDAALLKNTKMSSTFIRAWIAKKQKV
jgi:pantetheine-phosphate adenylyltransferase